MHINYNTASSRKQQHDLSFEQVAIDRKLAGYAMKTTKAEKFVTPMGSVFSVFRNATILKCLLVIFLSVVGSCRAQTNNSDNDNNVSVQAVVFVVIAAIMCLIFWACYACICFSKQTCAISTTPQPSPVHYSTRNTHQSNGYSQNSARDYLVPRRFLSHTENISGHSEFNHSAAARVGSHSPVRVSLPEATLHQADAPPTYEEAIGMKTVS